MSKDFTYFSNKILDTYDRVLRIRVKITGYFLIIVGPFSLLWGFINLVELLSGSVAPQYVAAKQSDVIIRMGTGAVLIIIWLIFFVVLRKK